MEAVRAMLAVERPTWRFTALESPSREAAARSYVDEVRTVASASIFVSLFGSSMHNCRFLAPATTVVEIHGALRLELDSRADYFYQSLCGGKLGVRWVGYAPDGFRPYLNASKAEKDAVFNQAPVVPHEFAAFMRRILRDEHHTLLREYAAQLRSHPARHVRQTDVPY